MYIRTIKYICSIIVIGILVLPRMGSCTIETTRDRENSLVWSDIFFNLYSGNVKKLWTEKY